MLKKKEKLLLELIEKKIPFRRVHRITCSLYADPHVHGFNKKYFEAQTEGDWVLYRGNNLSAHYRGKRFGGWVGPIKFGVRLFQHRIYSIGFTFDKLLINGRTVTIPNGELKLRGGIIRRNANKITFSTNDGEEVDFVTFGWFFNAYVRSNVPKITGICSQKFVKSHFFKHTVRAKIDHFKKRTCRRRRIFKKMCHKKGLKGKRLTFCIRDLCAGLPVKIELQIIKLNKKEDVVKIIKKKVVVNRITCALYADPHVHGFNNKYFEAQTVGDWLLYRGTDLSAHYRGKSFGSWVGPIKFGVRLFHNRIFSIGFTFDKLLINGRVRNISNGKTKLGHGEIRRNGNTITFSNKNGEEVDFVTFGSFFNAYVRSNVQFVDGICTQKFKRSLFFNHPHTPKVITFKKRRCPRRMLFRNKCIKKGLRGKRLTFCIRDLCNGLPSRIEKQILKINKKEDRKIVHVRRVHRVQCQLFADPHVYGFNKKNFEA